MSDIYSRWCTAFPDPAERGQWRRTWGLHNLDLALLYADALADAATGTPDPDTAYAWWRAGITAPDTRHLSQHLTEPPTREVMTEHYLTAAGERTLPDYAYNEEMRLRAMLLVAHPHLTQPDRDAITAAVLLGNVTLDEIAPHIAAGPIDRDTLHVMAGLR